MSWNPSNPDDFSLFNAADMPEFLEWWEGEHTDAIASQLSGAFVEGVTYPYLELLTNNPDGVPAWVQTMLRWRLAAQWAYQIGQPLGESVARGLGVIIPLTAGLEGLPDAYRITPQDIAEIPPQIRQGFLEGVKFSMGWVNRLSDDAREQTRQLLAINTLKSRNPTSAVPLLEQVLRRDLIAIEAGVSPESITAADVQQWLEAATFETLQKIAQRADLIAVTESARMQNMGILSSMEEKGQTLCYVMPHLGTCPECRRLVDGRVFRVQVLKQNLFANFGKSKAQWVASLPQHPRCRHSPMEVPFQFRKALRRFGIVPNEGVLLEWYGLPGGEQAFEQLGLEKLPWLTREGVVV